MLPKCVKPECEKLGFVDHHVQYASTDDRHFNCVMDGCPWAHCEEVHGEMVVELCDKHHVEITNLNSHKWRKRYHGLTCRERRYWFHVWMDGKVRVKQTLNDDRRIVKFK